MTNEDMGDNKKSGFNIQEYLKKFTSLTPFSKQVKKELIRITKECTGIVLQENEVTVNGRTLSITTSPIRKQEILRNKNVILSKLKESFNTTNSFQVL